jgi:hypothetical protein
MEWTQEVVDKLNSVFREKYRSMSIEKKTDRANMSAIWNRYLSLYEAVVLRDQTGKCDALTSVRTLSSLIDFINLQNENVAGRVAVRNPDRPSQWILISRDIAERVLVFGML